LLAHLNLRDLFYYPTGKAIDGKNLQTNNSNQELHPIRADRSANG
jgi:hypothetical protein